MKEFIKFYAENYNEVLKWLEEKYYEIPRIPSPFGSIDVRNAGFKLAHVDSNLFPSGFNNLDFPAIEKMAQYLAQYFEKYYPNVKRIALYPEQFTRNVVYQGNLMKLQEICEKAGMQRISFVVEDELYDQFHLANKVALSNFGDKEFDCIVLNNDLTLGVPQFLQETKLPIVPEPSLGWHNRLKSKHFEEYNNIIAALADEFSFDNWLLTTYINECINIDFRERKNLECIALAVDKTIHKIKRKYLEYGVNVKPFVFVKANKGTFGLGIMKVYAGDEIFSINKKQRHTMQKIKLGMENNSILIQEGVPTIDKIHDKVAESIVYSTNCKAVGYFERFNANKGVDSNLNSKGMGFTKSQELLKSDIKYLINKVSCIANVLEGCD